MRLFSFVKWRNLAKHIKGIHQKIKKFGCNQCNFSPLYKQKNLVKHIEAIHQNIKIYGCNECDFSTSYNYETLESILK